MSIVLAFLTTRMNRKKPSCSRTAAELIRGSLKLPFSRTSKATESDHYSIMIVISAAQHFVVSRVNNLHSLKSHEICRWKKPAQLANYSISAERLQDLKRGFQIARESKKLSKTQIWQHHNSSIYRNELKGQSWVQSQVNETLKWLSLLDSDFLSTLWRSFPRIVRWNPFINISNQENAWIDEFLEKMFCGFPRKISFAAQIFPK